LIVVAGSVAQRPGRAGHAWVFLQYLLGFQRLGYDVLFLDRLTEDMASGYEDEPPHIRFRTNVEWFISVMSTAGLRGSYSLRMPSGATVGLDRGELLAQVRRAIFLLDINGFLNDEEIAAATPQRVFLDIDPGFNQMWHELGLADILGGYDAYATLASRIGQPDCRIPTCGVSWIPSVPPVVLEAWRWAEPAPHGAFTSVMTWRGPFDPIIFKGERYGVRVHEFRRLASIPASSAERFSLALDIDGSDDADADTLTRAGWELIDPAVASSDLAAYQGFVQRSKAEFGVAKEMYVKTRSGWVSDRTVCYLATGRPVVVQDTGQRDFLGDFDGIAIFDSLEEALAQVGEVTRRYATKARAARHAAEHIFDSDLVLKALLRNLDIDPPGSRRFGGLHLRSMH
jgi:hypothetical protein